MDLLPPTVYLLQWTTPSVPLTHLFKSSVRITKVSFTISWEPWRIITYRYIHFINYNPVWLVFEVCVGFTYYRCALFITRWFYKFLQLFSYWQTSYGRFSTNAKGVCHADLLVMQVDGKKIVDPNKQNALSSRLRMELFTPLRVAVRSRGPDTELLVANPVELCGRGRPLVFYDITFALKTLNIKIFSVPSLIYFTDHLTWIY